MSVWPMCPPTLYIVVPCYNEEGVLRRTRIDRIAAEFDRIGRYSAMGHLASIEEAIVYQREKEARTYGHA